ncbi:Insulinase (Peptidase family M16) family protein [Trifolium repens]|nr:Insulinase (Peptidase family M16) family protein [Trifolium repens]
MSMSFWHLNMQGSKLSKKNRLHNSLQVLLVSDPDTDKCAASMSVGVSYFSDPAGLEGLAHFLCISDNKKLTMDFGRGLQKIELFRYVQHMLFYASEKYPVEDSYSKYITEHGGSTYALASSALDRFAQFLTKPLMSADATMREIKTIDSENQKNLLSDGWRMNQVSVIAFTVGF